MKRIEEQLVGNGNIMRGLHRWGRSLSAGDRGIIMRARERAIKEGLSRATINALEMEGERGTRGEIGYPVSSRFRGIQETSVRGLSLRLYDIEGDHPLNGSTVTVSTLLGKGIIPTDISFFRALFEAGKELAFMAYFESERIVDGARNVVRRVVKGVAMKKFLLLVALVVLTTGCEKFKKLTNTDTEDMHSKVLQIQGNYQANNVTIDGVPAQASLYLLQNGDQIYDGSLNVGTFHATPQGTVYGNHLHLTLSEGANCPNKLTAEGDFYSGNILTITVSGLANLQAGCYDKDVNIYATLVRP